MKKTLFFASIFFMLKAIADPVTLPPPVCSSCWDDPLAARKAEQAARAASEPPPCLSAYQAYPLPHGSCMSRIGGCSNIFGWTPTGLYISAFLGYSFLTIDGIENVSSSEPGSPVPATVISDASENKFTPGVAIGYQWADCGFNRLELAYMPIFNIRYNANPFLQGFPSTITSDITINPLLFKLYWDFDYGYKIIPYLQAGAGVAIVHTDSNSTITLPGLTFLQGDSSDTRGNFAWDVGFGTRIMLTPTVLLNFGYEFDWFGKAKWNITYPEETPPIFVTPVRVKLESNNIYSNTIIAGITWRPFYCSGNEEDSCT